MESSVGEASEIKSSVDVADHEIAALLEHASDLEAQVEASATFDDQAPVSHEDAGTTNQKLLTLIADTYGKISELKQKQSQSQEPEKDANDVADALLDYAIACKRANRMTDCAMAHLQRMKIVPKYFHTDALRLLGISADAVADEPHESQEHAFKIEEICQRGMFAAEKDQTKNRYRPSDEARNHAKAARFIFDKYRYTLKRCTEYLRPYIGDGGISSSNERIFSASSFLNHRHEIYEDLFSNSVDHHHTNLVGNGLQALVLLFLFGLAIPNSALTGAIEADEIDVLINAGLLRLSPACASDVIVAEVQIFPVSATDLFADVEKESKDGSKCVGDHTSTCLFATDFPLESMRLPRNAVMPVGYDTLELLSLSADGRNAGRILDVCCGCGIQGIFAHTQSRESALVLADINERAINFVTANLALNNIASEDAHALCCDLFDGLDSKTDQFDHILSNPPFVAVPAFSTPQLQPALYAIGGGTDGMYLLRRIFAKCLAFLKSAEKSTLLMVTEVPNVEESCEMLRCFLPEKQRNDVIIKVAYIEDDVETVNSYSKVRETEAGIEYSRDWTSPMQKDDIRNRALVLISIHYKSTGNATGDDRDLFCFVSTSNETADILNDQEVAADEEDLFLTREGIAFTRKSLLI